MLGRGGVVAGRGRGARERVGGGGGGVAYVVDKPRPSIAHPGDGAYTTAQQRDVDITLLLRRRVIQRTKGQRRQ